MPGTMPRPSGFWRVAKLSNTKWTFYRPGPDAQSVPEIGGTPGADAVGDGDHDDLAGSPSSRKQGGGSVTVVIRSALRLSWPHGQYRLAAIQGLAFAFSSTHITTVRVLSWGFKVQPDDIPHLLHH